ncbi:uncharacterized protein LOC113789331 [Dermatophagoides pteronyssinus]|uniref:Serine-rich 25 kDa antigen protein-like n=1 Tax=Dermatophagoides pteronyssinus TaxID=6956 RepID=A0A6P6XMD9_DERPT|nr:serine-rich 25 kDa antigen protein-like [Dermatophagoides pteronyssinus]
MSETAIDTGSNAEKTIKEMKSDVKPNNNQVSTNNVANDSKAQVKNDLKEDNETANTPGRKRKRVSEITDSSLVLETPPGVDGNRRQTRSQTRGTPAPTPAPTPVKKVSLANSNGSSANKGRRGRPPKSATSSSDSEEPIKMETTNAAVADEKKKEEKTEQKDADIKPVVSGSAEATAPAKNEGSKNTISDSSNVKEMKKSEDDVKKQPSTEKPKHTVSKPISVAVSNADKQAESSGNKSITSNKTTVANEVVNNSQSSTTNKPESATINNHEK